MKYSTIGGTDMSFSRSFVTKQLRSRFFQLIRILYPVFNQLKTNPDPIIR